MRDSEWMSRDYALGKFEWRGETHECVVGNAYILTVSVAKTF